METITLSRAELHEKVWLNPMVHVAKELWISDVGLRKVCIRLSVPTPPAGYWRRVERGFKPQRIPLPQPEQQGSHTFTKSDAVKIESAELKPIPVPTELRNPHPLIQETKRIWVMRKQKGNWETRDLHALDIRVTEDSKSRALRIMDAIINEAESRGAKVLVKGFRDTVVEIESEQIGFHIEENSRLEIIDDPKKREKQSWYRPERNYHPTGKLALILRWSPIRASYRDGAKQTVESVLPEFFENLMLTAAHRKEEHEKQKLEADEARKRAAKRELWQKREKILWRSIEALENTSRVEKYLVSIREQGGEEEWVEWVQKYFEVLKKAAVKPDISPDRDPFGQDWSAR